jgi:type IV secretory pathway VirJ component
VKQCGAVIQIHDAFVGLAQHAWRLLCRPGPRATCVAACAVLVCHCSASARGVHHEVISHGQFLRLQIYRGDLMTGDSVLLLSGDGGWGPELETIAERLARRGTLVAGIDAREWLKSLESSQTTCAAPGAYLADLGRYLRTRYALKGPPPVLVGHSAGATLAYVALAQGRAQDFSGALTLSFCTELDLSRPLCPAPPLREVRRPSGALLQPGGALPVPWVDLHGLDDRECPAAEARAFAAAIPQARFLPLPGEGHSYRDPEHWWGAFLNALEQLRAPRPRADAP